MDPVERMLNILPKKVNDGKSKTDHILTPYRTAKDMIDNLSDDVFNPNSTFLDINCKSGVFLYLLLKRLMESKHMIDFEPNNYKRYKYIVENQLYGISPCETCKFISKRLVYGSIQSTVNNIICIHGYYNKVIKGSIKSIKEVKSNIEGEFKTVKFDVVIGNPPYNRGSDIDFAFLGYDLLKEPSEVTGGAAMLNNTCEMADSRS